MISFYKQLQDLFKKDNNTKILQKDSIFMYHRFNTEEIKEPDDVDSFVFINCLNYISKEDTYYDKDVVNNFKFFKGFDNLCKYVIDKDFILFRGGYPFKEDTLLDEFIGQSHGSGVNSLFYLYYIITTMDSSTKNIVIDNIDGILHPVSMVQLFRYFKDNEDYNVIFLMNQDVLLDTTLTGLDNFYIIHDFRVYPIGECTDRELRQSHNLQKMFRCGEFDIDNEQYLC